MTKINRSSVTGGVARFGGEASVGSDHSGRWAATTDGIPDYEVLQSPSIEQPPGNSPICEVRAKADCQLAFWPLPPFAGVWLTYRRIGMRRIDAAQLPTPSPALLLPITEIGPFDSGRAAERPPTVHRAVF
jgi:hypothetical protein